MSTFVDVSSAIQNMGGMGVMQLLGERESALSVSERGSPLKSRRFFLLGAVLFKFDAF